MKLKEYMSKNGFTLTELADMLDVDKGNLKHWIDLGVSAKLAARFNEKLMLTGRSRITPDHNGKKKMRESFV